jgi:hypothetical protein
MWWVTTHSDCEQYRISSRKRALVNPRSWPDAVVGLNMDIVEDCRGRILAVLARCAEPEKSPVAVNNCLDSWSTRPENARSWRFCEMAQVRRTDFAISVKTGPFHIQVIQRFFLASNVRTG